MSILHDEKHPLPDAHAQLVFHADESTMSTTRGTTNDGAVHARLIDSNEEFQRLTGDDGARRVLLAVDARDGGASAQALQWALAEFVRDGDVLTLLHVVPESAVADLFYEDATTDSTRVRDAMMADALKTIQQFVPQNMEPLLAAKNVKVFVEVKIGDPRDVICEVAKQSMAATVVMGSRGQGMFKRFMLGSVSSYVTQYCERPVTVVHVQPDSTA
ncbi:hypothetical protein GGF32_007702 [Allomyces javanicus]|nr:hypothetical protein GGF32_007702 [Allomyces javanicus]